MATGSVKHTISLYFRDSTEKDGFILRMKRIRQRLTLPRESVLSYHDLMLSMLDALERQTTQATVAAERSSMLRNNGKCLAVTVATYMSRCSNDMALAPTL